MITQSVPYEMFLAIFSHCDKDTLSNICRTSRVFLNDVSNLLYQRVCLERRDIQSFLNASKQFHRIKHFALLYFYPDEGLNGPWTTLLLAVQETCELVSFKLLGSKDMPVEEVYPYTEAILKIKTLKYVVIHTFHVDIQFAVRVPALKELDIRSPYPWPNDLPPTPHTLRATPLSLSLGIFVTLAQLRSHFNLQRLRKLALCSAYYFGGTPNHILDLLKGTASTLEELSFWFYSTGDAEFLHRSVELPKLRVLILSDSIDKSCRSEAQYFPMLQDALSRAPRLEEVRLCCEWILYEGIGPNLLRQLPSLPDFSPQIKRFHFELLEPEGNSRASDLLIVKEMIREKWGQNRELTVSVGCGSNEYLTAFCEPLHIAASREYQE
ncbi:hypothetical protein DL96DRAFT_1821186, partial [Flagelloscypha sp. PMI_526]